MKNKYLLTTICTLVFFAILTNTVNAVASEPNPELQATCGIDIALVLDSSGSISSSDMVIMKDAFIGFVDILLPNTPTQFSVIDFDDYAVIVQSFTNNKTAIINAINTPTSGGCTNWEDGLLKANDTFDPRIEKPDLVLFASDGNPNTVYGGSPCGTSEAVAVSAAVTVANTMKLNGIRITTLGIGNNIDSANLIAISSSDAYYDVNEFDELEETLETIASELCGGTISVQKKVDGEPEAGWEFSLTVTNGTATPNPGITDGSGFVVFDINITQGSEAIVNITETLKPGYQFDNVYAENCSGVSVGTPGTNAIYGIPVKGDCAIYCLFNNTNLTGTDDTPPVTNKTVGNPKYGPNDEWVTESTEFNLTAYDNESGVNATYYRIWYMGVWSPWMEYDGNFNLTGNCMHYIEFYSVDNAGNQEAIQNQTHYVDEMAPITDPYPPEFGISYTTIEYEGDQYVVINCNTSMWINVSDPSCGIGVYNISYSIWYYDASSSNYVKLPGSDVIVYDNDPDDLDPDFGEISVLLTIDEECLHQVRWKVVDLFGHTAMYDYSFAVDCTPPDITKTHPDPCYYPLNSTAGIIQVGGRIVLEAEDGGTPPCISGVENIYYGFWYDGKWYPEDPFDEYCGNYNITMYKDGKWWYTYSNPINFHEECKHVLEYWARDKVFNSGPTHTQIYWVNDCQDEVWIDDTFGYSTPGFYHDHFVSKQMALDWLGPGGFAYVFDGSYHEDIVIDDIPCCDNTGITQLGEYGCFPIDESAIIFGSETIKVNGVTIKYLEYEPNTNGAIIVEEQITGTTLRCNKFRKDCVADAIGVNALGDSIVNAELNWWGRPDGPDGGIMDDGKTANGLGVKVLGQVFVEPWIGIHAEIAEPVGTIVVELGTPIHFDASESWAYTYGQCCQEAELLPMQYEWNFDDGTYSHNKVTTHLYDSPGTYEVILMVDAPGIPGLYGNLMYDWDYVTVHVVTPGTPLTANADGKTLGGYETIVGETVQLYGDAYGGSGDYIFTWNFGDNSGTVIEQNPVHVYDLAGTYTATLTVTSGGETATDTAEVIVHDIEELIVNIADTDAVQGVETWFTLSVSGGTKPYSYSWDFGDGATSTEASPGHVYDVIDKYTVKVTITDSKGKIKSDTATVNVVEGESIELLEIKDVKCTFGSVQATIKTGTYQVDWTIEVNGNLVFLGGYDSGSIQPSTTLTVSTPFTFGLGKVEIKVTANYVIEKRNAFLIGPIFLGVKEIN